VIAALGTVLAAGYLLWMLQKTAFGTPTEEFENDPHINDATTFEWIAWVPLLILIVVLGVMPNLLFNLTDDAVVKSLQVEGGGSAASNCLDLASTAGQACFDEIRGVLEAAQGGK